MSSKSTSHGSKSSELDLNRESKYLVCFFVNSYLSVFLRFVVQTAAFKKKRFIVLQQVYTSHKWPTSYTSSNFFLKSPTCIIKPIKRVLHTHRFFLRDLSPNHNTPLKHSRAKSELPTIVATSGKEDFSVFSAWWVTFLRRLSPVESAYTERTTPCGVPYGK